MQFFNLYDIKKYLKESEVSTFSGIVSMFLSLEKKEAEAIKKRIPRPFFTEEIDNELCIEANCLSMAIILGEYDTALRLAGIMTDLFLVMRQTHVGNKDDSVCFDIPFVNLLYSVNIDIPENLRFAILENCSKTMLRGCTAEGGFIDIDSVWQLGRTAVQAKIINDYRKKPEYFDYKDDPGEIKEIQSACFLMKLYKNEPKKLDCLISRISIRYSVYSWKTSGYMKNDIRMLKNAWEYDWMMKYRPIIFTMLISVYIGVCNACEEDVLYFLLEDLIDDELKKIKRIRSELARFICSMKISEEDFLKSMDRVRDFGFEATVKTLSFGKKIFGYRPDFVINALDGVSVESFFGISPDETGTDTHKIQCMILRFADSIGKIRYRVWKSEEIGAEIVWFLKHNAEMLKDSFLIFAEKGLVPDEHLDYVINKLSGRADNCSFMLPILIMQKYGRLRENGK